MIAKPLSGVITGEDADILATQRFTHFTLDVRHMLGELAEHGDHIVCHHSQPGRHTDIRRLTDDAIIQAEV